MTATRQQILDAFWGGAVPRANPQAHALGYTAAQKALHTANIERCTVLRMLCDGGLWLSAWVYYPVSTATPRNHALIYHAGHESDFTLNWIVTGAALARGYTVCEIFMVGYGSTDAPYDNADFPTDYTLPGGGTVPLAVHNDLSAAQAAGEKVLPLFLDPTFRAVAWLRKQGFAKIGVTGHSGGGWASLMAGALDTEIDFVASIHGWCPIGASGEPVSRDIEQNDDAWFADLGMNYPDYSALIGARRQLIVTGSLDPLFGAAALGQGNIDTMVAAIQATGANLAQSTIAAPDHDTTAAEATYVLDEFDALCACPQWKAPRWSGTLATATDLARIVSALAGYPARGTLAVAAVDLGAGNGRVDLSTQDFARLYDAAQVATLSGADQAIVAAQRGSFTSR